MACADEQFSYFSGQFAYESEHLQRLHRQAGEQSQEISDADSANCYDRSPEASMKVIGVQRIERDRPMQEKGRSD
jgi:hypothetical protein